MEGAPRTGAQSLGGQEKLGGEDIGLALDLPVGGLPGSSDVAVEHQVTDLVSQVEARALRRLDPGQEDERASVGRPEAEGIDRGVRQRDAEDPDTVGLGQLDQVGSGSHPHSPGQAQGSRGLSGRVVRLRLGHAERRSSEAPANGVVEPDAKRSEGR